MEQVHALWIGRTELGPLEILTIKSFQRHGAAFNLWTFGPIKNIPFGTTVRDGNEILPESRIFRYPPVMYMNHGANSLVGFSELFRYKVLYEHGGWWSDMDVTCLKPLSIHTTDYYFRFHGVLSVVGNIMKCPPRSELMRLCFERSDQEINETTKDWHQAIRILCYYIEFLGLSQYIRYDTCNLDIAHDFYRDYLDRPGSLDQIPEGYDFLHWMNSMNPRCAQGSVLDLLFKKYKCHEPLLKYLV